MIIPFLFSLQFWKPCVEMVTNSSSVNVENAIEARFKGHEAHAPVLVVEASAVWIETPPLLDQPATPRMCMSVLWWCIDLLKRNIN